MEDPDIHCELVRFFGFPQLLSDHHIKRDTSATTPSRILAKHRAAACVMLVAFSPCVHPQDMCSSRSTHHDLHGETNEW